MAFINKTTEKQGFLSRFRTSEKRIGIPAKIMLVIFIGLLILIDQLTKVWAINSVKNNPMKIIEGVLHFEYTENTGVAFGLFRESVFVVYILTTILILAGVVVLFSDVIYKSKVMYIAGGLIVAGGVGNLIDRYFRRFVVDFINAAFVDFKLFNNHISFPIFNVADMCVVVGAVLLMIAVLFIVPAEHKIAPAESAEAGEEISEDTENYFEE